MFLNHKSGLLILALTLLLTACGGGGDSTPAAPVLSTDATLSALTLSVGAISPIFASDTIAYTQTTSSASTTVTPTVNQANATVTVDGTAVASGAEASIALAVGTTAISVVVTAQDSSTTQTYTVTVSQVISRALVDPTPGTDLFGLIVVQLANGNIVVSDKSDSSVASGSGAVHLYSPFSSTPIASIYGDGASDKLGNLSITALGNSNYVIVSEQDDEGGIVNAGSVRLMNGTTGVQIAMLAGDVLSDQLGFSGVTALDNNNYVIASRFDDEGGIVDAGSARLMNGTTGAQIAMLAGDVLSDQLGNSGITALDNNNYVIISRLDDEGGIVDAGSVRLMHGTTGVAIGAAIVGAVADDMLSASVTKPINGDFYVLSQPLADSGGLVNAGMVRIVSP